ncbi:MAG: GNAT family N-acetyltransferase [Leptospiraceae bacterium]|nr:GNAT family N-acetyltransferase [Leptospiraceae bacterium]
MHNEPKLADTDETIMACYPALSQLRPHISENQFLRRIRLQQSSGYRLALLMEGSAASIGSELVRCVAGFRILENLAWGRVLYVDDLVTLESARSGGYGKRMLDWLKEEARSQGCQQLQLDSGVQRKDAHRFYEREGMDPNGLRFAFRIQEYRAGTRKKPPLA